jgi:FkbM family methyltransferase
LSQSGSRRVGTVQMKNQIEWLKALPLGLAVKLIAIFMVRKLTRLPISFSYAQGAEDIIIPYIAHYHFGIEGPGKYVDVGCNTPVKYSNTFLLYLIGWRGLNVDANAELIDECKRVRRQDICLRAAVSDIEREVTFHKAKDDAVSTIDETRLVEWKKYFEFSDADQERLVTRTLTSILDENWKAGDAIDLLSIDVEGHDFQVLQSLDLARYRPKIVVIEMHTIENLEENEIYRYLTSNGYAFRYYAVLNAYFVDTNH